MMKNTVICVNPETHAAQPMRNILGMNNTPRIMAKRYLDYEKTLFDALNIRYVRYHDAAPENYAQMLVDIHRIFPLFHLDESDPRNYVFKQTEDYIAVAENAGAEIDFRLGETIDHSLNDRLIGVPEDINKWARICRAIIGHFKNGEMDGIHANITRVTVWEEPDNPRLFAGNVQQYAEMFCAVYKLLKKDFPELKVGGPTMCSHSLDFLREFLKICKQNDVTPDYMTVTIYVRSVEKVLELLDNYRSIAREEGFEGIKIQIAEWHLEPVEWVKEGYMTLNGFDSSVSAAYSASLLTALMDIPDLEIAYYYAWATIMWSVMDFRSDEFEPLPVYYGLMSFQKLAVDCGVRLDATAENADGVQILAGKTADGKVRLLVSCYEQEARTIHCRIGAARTCLLRAITRDGRLTAWAEGETLEADENGFRIDHAEGSAVYLLETEA